MLKVCENCIDRQQLSYEDLIAVCGRCREVKKADLVDHADKKDLYNFKQALNLLVEEVGLTEDELVQLVEAFD